MYSGRYQIFHPRATCAYLVELVNLQTPSLRSTRAANEPTSSTFLAAHADIATSNPCSYLSHAYVNGAQESPKSASLTSLVRGLSSSCDLLTHLIRWIRCKVIS